MIVGGCSPGCIRPFRGRVGLWVVSRLKTGVVGGWVSGWVGVGAFHNLLAEPRMAIKEELAAKPARQLAETFSEEVYGPDGPELDCDIDEIEDLAVLAARAAFDAVIARALLQNQKPPDQLARPKCERPRRVGFEKRTAPGRMGPAEIQEPICHCSKCDRVFWSSESSAVQSGASTRAPFEVIVVFGR